MRNKNIFTIPNILSMFRLLLLPVIVYMYMNQKDYVLTGILLLISGLTDLLDGYIARTFNMMSDLGKILDPVADKATQAVVLLCLMTRFSWLTILFICIFTYFTSMYYTPYLHCILLQFTRFNRYCKLLSR